MIIGKVYFLLVRIKIKHMELAVIRREAAGTGPQQYNESETITKFEAAPGECCLDARRGRPAPPRHAPRRPIR